MTIPFNPVFPPRDMDAGLAELLAFLAAHGDELLVVAPAALE